jgi:uncharacterized membrane protein
MGLLAVLLTLHIVGVVIWVGGMFFAYFCLRPVLADSLDPPERLRIWRDLFARFFVWVWWSVALIIGSGLAMLFRHGFASAPPAWHLMMGSGLVMIGFFVFVARRLFPALDRAVNAEDWSHASLSLAQIRQVVGINLVLGLITIAIATAGNFLL